MTSINSKSMDEPFFYSFQNEYDDEDEDDYCSTCHPPRPPPPSLTARPVLVQKEFMPTFYNPFETKHRRRTSRSQFKLLEASFEENTKPNAQMRRWLAQKLGMTPRSVQVWFQNRRAKAKGQMKKKYQHHQQQPLDSPSQSTSPSFQSPIESEDGALTHSWSPDLFTTTSTTKPDTMTTIQWQSQPQQQPQQQHQHQQQEEAQMTFDSFSMLMDQPDLMSWYSPMSSPLPCLLTPPSDPIHLIQDRHPSFSSSTSSTFSLSFEEMTPLDKINYHPFNQSDLNLDPHYLSQSDFL